MRGTGIDVRPAGAEDRSSLERLEQACFPDPWSRRSIEGLLENDADLVLVAGGPVDAYAAFRRAGDEAELLRIAVSPERRRRGFARELLREGLDRLARRGVITCFLEVRSANLPARALYESEGFRAVGVRPRYYGDGTDALLYRYRPAAVGRRPHQGPASTLN
jgi:ribosomal-protein-alanine acetyltransferase